MSIKMGAGGAALLTLASCVGPTPNPELPTDALARMSFASNAPIPATPQAALPAPSAFNLALDQFALPAAPASTSFGEKILLSFARGHFYSTQMGLIRDDALETFLEDHPGTTFSDLRRMSR